MMPAGDHLPHVTSMSPREVASPSRRRRRRGGRGPSMARVIVEDGAIPMSPPTKESSPSLPAPPTRKALFRVGFIIGTPLVLSLILCIVGVTAIISVNVKYAKEAAETFPRELMKPLAYHVKQEVESSIHELHRIYTEVSASHRTNMMKIPAYNYHQGNDTVYNIPSGAPYHNPMSRITDDATVMEEFARRAEWRRQTSAAVIRVTKGNPKSAMFSLAFISDASSNWYTRVEGLGETIMGATYYGEDVRRAERFQPPEDGTSSAEKQTRAEMIDTVDSSNNFEYIDNQDSFFLISAENSKVYQRFASEDADIKASQGPDATQKEKHDQPRPFINLVMFYNVIDTTIDMQLEMTGPIYDFTNTLVGLMRASMSNANIDAALARITPPSARYTTTTFLMDDSGVLSSVGGYSARRDVITLEVMPELDLDDPSSWPPLPEEKGTCMYTALGIGEDYEYAVMVLCMYKPEHFKDPIVKASASHLRSLCAETINVTTTTSSGDDGLSTTTTAAVPNPLLGQAQTVVLEVNAPVNGGVRRDAHTIVCDRVDTASRGLRMMDASLLLDDPSSGPERPPAIYDSWRIVTIVSEREIVDPLLGDFASKSIIVGVAGACAAAGLCIIAASISVLLLKRMNGLNWLGG